MSDANEEQTPEKHPCDDGDGGFDHEPEWISDWYGDPNVINGTADCSGWACKRCGEELEGDPPGDDYEPDRSDYE